MTMNLVGIAGTPPRQDLSGCGCQGSLGEEAPTAEQASSLRWVAVGLVGLAVVGLVWMQRRTA